MTSKTNLFLFLAITAILFTSPLVSEDVFADKNDDKKKKTFEQMCAKKKGNEPDALFCQAILGLQQSTNSFFDIFTELRLVDTNLQNQIDSFFDIFVELDDVANTQCLPGQVATGTNLDGTLQCTDITQNQECDDGFYMYGIDEDGQIKCKPLPSGSSSVCGNAIVESSEQCDLGVNNGGTSSCSVICTIQTTDLCLGVNVDDGNECTTDTCSAGVAVHTDNGFCTEAVCGDGLVTAPETCDDNDVNPGDGCDATCQVESGFSCVGSPSVCLAVCDADTNPVCSLSYQLPSVSGDSGEDMRTVSDHGEKWYALTITEDSFLGGTPEAAITLQSNGGDNYDLYVYCESCGGALIGSSTFPAGLMDFVSVRSSADNGPFGNGADDTFTVLIEVRSVSVNSCSDYTLTVAGNIVSDYGDIGLC